jgi:hypothetical protein
MKRLLCQKTFYSKLLFACVCNMNNEVNLAVELAYSTGSQMDIHQ